MNKKKKKFAVSVDVTREYIIEVEAENAQEAGNKVEAMTPAYIDKHGEYMETYIVADDESEEA